MKTFETRGPVDAAALHQYLQGTQVTDHLSMLRFFPSRHNGIRAR